MRWLTRLLLSGVIVVWASVLPATAFAHPLGNFTVNRYSRLEVSPDRVQIRYVVDLAEIPTFQAMAVLDPSHGGVVDDARRTDYVTAWLNDIARHLQLTIDGADVRPVVSSWTLDLLPGQGGLQTMRLAAWLEVPISSQIPRSTNSRLTLDYRDDNEPDRIGWREIVLRPGDGVGVVDSTAPSVDTSNELRSYPVDQLTSPLNRRAAHATLSVTGVSSVPHPATSAGPVGAGSTVASLPFSSFLGQSTSLTDVVAAGRLGTVGITIALLLAAIWGAAHALTPGHGKTVVGAYLVGSRGTPWHALYLGVTVTATHTIGIYALGLVTIFASRFILPETLFPWLSLLSGLAVVTIGLTLVRTRLRGYRGQLKIARANAIDVSGLSALPRGEGQGDGEPHRQLTVAHASAGQTHDDDIYQHAHDDDPPLHHQHSHDDHVHPREHVHLSHDHRHDDDSHPHDHGHGGQVHSHEHAGHSHLPPGADGKPVTWRSLLALGVAGGLLPCPSALVLLLGAIALGQVVFGLVLVVAFSLGLAVVLTGIGVAMVYTGRLASRVPLVRRGRQSRFLDLAPVGSALVISLIGLAMTAEALRQTGLI